MPGKCDQCGVEEYMPYVCKFCRGRYCAAHRLPENHDCQGLGPYRERLRAEGRVMAPEPGVVRPQMSATARAGMSMDAFWAKVNGKMTFVLLGVMMATFLAQVLVCAGCVFGDPRVEQRGESLHDALFVITPAWASTPWTVITSIFAHGSISHILFNGIALFFFGSTTERLIGTRRFTLLFLVAGAVGGIAQVVLTQLIFDVSRGGLGASGAIQGIMGTLVVLAPRLTVLVMFVVPAPLWAFAAFYVFLDLMGAISPGSRVGHFAHLSGLAVGLAFGFWLRKKGLRAVVTRPPPITRKYF